MAIFYQPPEPRQAYPKVLPQTQGAQPKPTGPLGGSVNALTAVGVWATLAAVPMPVQKPLNVVPLTLKYGSQPAPQPSLGIVEQVIARVWWPERSSQWNDQQPERRMVAQTLPREQPAPRAPLSRSAKRGRSRSQAPPSSIPVAAIIGVPAGLRAVQSDQSRDRTLAATGLESAVRIQDRAAHTAPRGFCSVRPAAVWDHRNQLAVSVGATVCSVERPRCRPVRRAQRPTPAIGVGLGASGTAPACCDRSTHASPAAILFRSRDRQFSGRRSIGRPSLRRVTLAGTSSRPSSRSRLHTSGSSLTSWPRLSTGPASRKPITQRGTYPPSCRSRLPMSGSDSTCSSRVLGGERSPMRRTQRGTSSAWLLRAQSRKAPALTQSWRVLRLRGLSTRTRESSR
jgi:hypothetical protein